MRLFTFLITLAMATGVLVLPAQARAADASDASKVTATFAPENLGVLTPGQDLTLDGVISNATASGMPAGIATVYLNRTAVSSRTDLAAWLSAEADPGDRLGTQVLQVDIPEIPAGRTYNTQLTVPASALNLGSAWGARTVAVRIASGDSELEVTHTSVVWNPGGDVPKTRLAVATPLTIPAGTDGLIPADQLANYTSTGGLLSRELSEAIDTDAAIAVDPRIIASIRILGDTVPASAKSWLEQLGAATNDTFALSYADSDLAGASQAGAMRTLDPSFVIDPKLFPDATVAPTPTSDDSTPTPTPTPTGPPQQTVPDAAALMKFDYTIPTVAWPADDTVVPADLTGFASNGYTTTILSSSNLSFGDLGYTPTAAAKVGDQSVLVSDAALSSLVRTATEASTDIEWKSAMAGLSATLAVVGRERPTDSRILLATLDRTSPGAQFSLSRTLQAVFGLGWAAPAALTDLTTQTSQVGATVTAKPEPAARVAQVKGLLDSEASVGGFSSILADPTVLTAERRQSLLALLSNSWSVDDAWGAAVQKYLTKSTKILGSVTIAAGGSLFVPADRINLPVTVNNDLAWPISVVVTARSPNGILNVVTNSVNLTVEADSQAKGYIPVKSLANGKVAVRTSLASPTNVPIGQETRLNVEVQAQWESAFTGTVAVIVILVFGLGIWRNIAKRRKRRAAAAATPDDAESPTP
ncbi:MAG TPA: DUF6049 family protein [Lacisediminihabitans sp.]|uniref:DUF6049 family protein n=1 Tax=Lacisediminihabitans sp. TaxID=2787631 RepID=UPI002ED8ADC7